jgi:thymidine phosphorylase
MREVARFEGEDGSFMLVEVELTGPESDVGLVVDRPDGTRAALTRLEDSLASVRGAGIALLSTVSQMKRRSQEWTLNEVTLELALALGVEGGVVVAKGSAKAEASVTLTWTSATGA